MSRAEKVQPVGKKKFLASRPAFKRQPRRAEFWRAAGTFAEVSGRKLAHRGPGGARAPSGGSPS